MLGGIAIEALAKRFEHEQWPPPGLGGVLKDLVVVHVGYGSIARPLSQLLAEAGARRFVLIDPKEYKPSSVDSQCELSEVATRKVDAGKQRLEELGAEVTNYASDFYSVPEGVIGPNALVVATVDNRRADIGANRVAARAGSRLLKVNVEPQLDAVGVRAYDFRRETKLCVECQFGEREYADRHPQSCDGPGEERATNTPRWLSEFAAGIGVMAAADLAADGPETARWYEQDVQYFRERNEFTRSRLTPNAHCRFAHSDRRWANCVRLLDDLEELTLRRLFREARVGVDARAAIRFCQKVTLSGRCSACQKQLPLVRWLSDLNVPIGRCACGGGVYAIGYWTFAEVTLDRLVGVLDSPLAEWGVEPGAVIEISGGERRRAFVVGAKRWRK
jgi:hypothetical protein